MFDKVDNDSIDTYGIELGLIDDIIGEVADLEELVRTTSPFLIPDDTRIAIEK